MANGRIKTALTTLNIAVVAPMPSQREYGDNCEARTLREDTLSVVKILHHFINEAETARLPAFLFDALDGAELKASAAQRFLARYAAADQISGERLDMKPELRIHFAFHTRTMVSRPQPRTKSAPTNHTSSGFVPRIPAITSAMLFQFWVSACKRRFPAAVSR